MDKKKEIRKEDTTKYGEFVCSEHHWLPPEEQKKKAKELEDITKSSKNVDKI